MKKIFFTCLSAIIFSCSSQAGGNITGFSIPFFPFFAPSPTPSDVKVSASLTNNGALEKKFTEPLTKTQFAEPRLQVLSYQKILRALELNDFEYIFKEYDAGGLKISAARAETEFGDYPINYTISSIAQNIGQIGIDNRKIYDIDTSEKRLILKSSLKNVLIYATRGQIRKLVENNKNNLTGDDKYGKDVANNAQLFFYGNENEKAETNSLAEFSQKLDNANKVKTYDVIANGLNKLKSESNKGNVNNLIFAKNEVETGLLKILYISTLDKVANAMQKNDINILIEGEFNYLALRNYIKSVDNSNTFEVEKIFLRKDPQSINYLKFEKALASGFLEKTKAEMLSALNNIVSKNDIAINSAQLAKMYLDIINANYDNVKFTKTGDYQINNNINSFITAIKSKDKTLAESTMKKLNELFFKRFV